MNALNEKNKSRNRKSGGPREVQLHLQLPITARFPATDDCRLGWLPPLACAAPLGQFSGRTAGMPSPLAATFAAAHRMRHGIHGHAANVGANPHPSFASRLPQTN